MTLSWNIASCILMLRSFDKTDMDQGQWPYITIKASVIKDAILVFAFQTHQHLRYLGWTFLHFITSKSLEMEKCFDSDVLGLIDSIKKFDRDTSSEVHEVCKMLGCLKCKYENCIVNRWCLHRKNPLKNPLQNSVIESLMFKLTRMLGPV